MLRGASAEARAALAPTVAGARSAEENAALGEDLLGVAGVLRAEPTLRRVTTDASVEGDAKAGLVAQLFKDKVGETALALLQEAVRQRWTSARDLLSVLEAFGIEAVVRSAGDRGDTISDELFAVRQLVEGNPDLRAALSDPARSAADKADLLSGLLSDKVSPAALRLVSQAVRADAPIARTLDDYQHLAASVHREVLATVHTARPLSAEEQTRLSEALGRVYDATVHLLVVEDPTLVGGLRVEIGDDVIDGSVSTRLDQARRRIAG